MRFHFFKHWESRPSRAFTLIELLVAIAIIAILAAILFPVFARARENARRASCLGNLKQVGLAFLQYTQDYDEAYPLTSFQASGETNESWTIGAAPYMKSTRSSAVHLIVHRSGTRRRRHQRTITTRLPT